MGGDEFKIKKKSLRASLVMGEGGVISNARSASLTG